MIETISKINLEMVYAQSFDVLLDRLFSNLCIGISTPEPFQKCLNIFGNKVKELRKLK